MAQHPIGECLLRRGGDIAAGATLNCLRILPRSANELQVRDARLLGQSGPGGAWIEHFHFRTIQTLRFVPALFFFQRTVSKQKVARRRR
jgi:hypothetical protein